MTTKITLKIRNDILEAFSCRLNECFLKRDAFLNYVIRLETPRLKEEMSGRKLSAAGRRYVSHQLMVMDKTTINVVVDKQTAEALKRVLKESNIVRDAFANRLMLLLLAPDNLLDWLELPREVTDHSLSSAESMPTSPLGSIHSSLGDPFYYLRCGLIDSDDSLYTIPLPGQFEALACYLDDAFVPGTEAFLDRVAEEEYLPTLFEL